MKFAALLLIGLLALAPKAFAGTTCGPAAADPALVACHTDVSYAKSYSWSYPSWMSLVSWGGQDAVFRCDVEELPPVWDANLNKFVQQTKRGAITAVLGYWYFLPPWTVYANDSPVATGIRCNGPLPPPEPEGGFQVVWIIINWPEDPYNPCPIWYYDGGWCGSDYIPPAYTEGYMP